MIGFECVDWPGRVRCVPGSGDVAREGPLGVEERERRRAGEEREAAFWRALARSGSCMRVVRRERREVRFGRESTRWKRWCSAMEEGPLCCSSESSQSEESSSSSIADSEISVSSSSE